MRDWSELLPDILSLICNRIASFEDLVAFGGVCASWRLVAVELNHGTPLLPLPWLMLSEKVAEASREFYSPMYNQIRSFDLPELRGKFCMESKGWIVTASKEGEMGLVHPPTRSQISLPHQNTSMCFDDHPMDPLTFVRRVVLSSPPNSDADCVVMIIHGGVGHLGFCRPGDKVWTVIGDKNNRNCAFQCVEHYRGKFYAVDYVREVWEYDVMGVSDTCPISPRLVGVTPYENDKEKYLVKSKDTLLAVIRIFVIGEDEDYPTSEFKVFEIDVEQGGYTEVINLGNRSIFLGYNAPLCLDSSWYPGLMPNSIYFTDDCCQLPEPYRAEGRGNDMGIYNLGDKSIRSHYSGKSLSVVCPPTWVFLTSR